MSAHIGPTYESIKKLCGLIETFAELGRREFEAGNELLYLEILKIIDEKCGAVEDLLATITDDQGEG